MNQSKKKKKHLMREKKQGFLSSKDSVSQKKERERVK